MCFSIPDEIPTDIPVSDPAYYILDILFSLWYYFCLMFFTLFCRYRTFYLVTTLASKVVCYLFFFFVCFTTFPCHDNKSVNTYNTDFNPSTAEFIYSSSRKLYSLLNQS